MRTALSAFTLTLALTGAAAGAACASAKAAPSEAGPVLRDIVLPERAAASWPDTAKANCRRKDSDTARCNVSTATLDGDVVWKGTAAVTWAAGSDRFRYRISGTKTLCAPGGSGGCNQREFTWKGRGCGSVLVNFAGEGEGSAGNLHAVRIGCSRARSIARDCMHGNGHGRKAARLVGPGRNGLRARGGAKVTWMLAGGGGCDELFD